jgi:hypothetical protein
MAAEQPEAAEALAEAFLGRIARSGVIGVVNRFATTDLPAEHFERLGALHYGHGGPERAAFFRLLGEDDGCAVWSHPDLEPFLKETYRRLVFPPTSSRHPSGKPWPTVVIGTEFPSRAGAVLRRSWRKDVQAIWPPT